MYFQITGDFNKTLLCNFNPVADPEAVKRRGGGGLQNKNRLLLAYTCKGKRREASNFCWKKESMHRFFPY